MNLLGEGHMQNRQFLQVSAIVCDLKQHLQRHLPKSSSQVNSLCLKTKLGVRKVIAKFFFNLSSFANSVKYSQKDIKGVWLIFNTCLQKKHKTIFSNSSQNFLYLYIYSFFSQYKKNNSPVTFSIWIHDLSLWQYTTQVDI